MQDDIVGGVAVSDGDTGGISPNLFHSHPEFWPKREGFDPPVPESATFSGCGRPHLSL